MSQPETRNPKLETEQLERLKQYADLLASFTRKHNLISPNTIPEIWERHIEHCLAIASKGFPDGCTVVDWGTGGGLPAIPLAMVFPKVQFVGVDAVGKKVMAVRAMARQLGLTNLEVWHGRAESWDGTLHYSVSRATAPLSDLWFWHNRAVDLWEEHGPEQWSQGLICLKGGDLAQEIEDLKRVAPSLTVKKTPLEEIMRATFVQEKYIMHICNTLVV